MANNWYANLLKDVTWQKRRLELLQLGNWTCYRCKRTTGEMHVHHKKYEYGKAPWDYPDSNFLVLCSGCHKKEHRPVPINQLIGELVKPPPIVDSINEKLGYWMDKIQGEITDEEMSAALTEIKNLQKKRTEIYPRNIWH